MNIIFSKITLHNFGSYAHAELPLRDRGFCLVTGRNNFKKDNALSNGSGKSFIWSAICFALTGETIQGLSKNLKNINNDEEDSYVSLEFQVDADVYKVTRQIAPKSDMAISKNGVSAGGKGIRESEKVLGEMLPDLNRDLISTMIILGQGMPNKFSSFSPSGRKELLERLTKSDFMIEDVKKRVHSRQDEIKKKHAELHDSLLVSTTQKSSAEADLKRVVDDLSRRVKPDFDSKIADIDTKISSMSDEILKIADQKAKLQNEQNAKNAELLSLSQKKSKEHETLLEGYTSQSSSFIQERSSVQAEISSLRSEIRRIESIRDVCPTCGQKLIGVEKPSTEPLKQKLSDKEKILASVEKTISEANARLSSRKAEIESRFKESLQKLSDEVRQLAFSASSLDSSKSQLERSMLQLRSDLNKLSLERDSWDEQTRKEERRKADLETQISSFSNAMKLTQLALDDCEQHLDVVGKIDTLIKRDFRGYLLSNIIQYLDKKAKEFCQIVFKTSDISISLDGNNLDITYCGKMFDNLSGGEKTRVDLILQFAIRDMMSAYLDVTSNMIVLDEVTDFLDKTSCDAIMQLISSELNSTESVFIVSHHADELELPIDSEIHVTKNEDGISEIA